MHALDGQGRRGHERRRGGGGKAAATRTAWAFERAPLLTSAHQAPLLLLPFLTTTTHTCTTHQKHTPQAANLSPALLLLTAVAWAALLFATGAMWLPGHTAWCAGLLWVSALIGAELAHWCRIPRMTGMLLAGLLLRNVGAMAGFEGAYATAFGRAALATIFLRVGLEIELSVRFACLFVCVCVGGGRVCLLMTARAQVLKPKKTQKTPPPHTQTQKQKKSVKLFWTSALRLELPPFVCEVAWVTGIAVALFSMPPALGAALGCVLAAVGPALIVPQALSLEMLGLGVDKGIPVILLITAPMDGARMVMVGRERGVFFLFFDAAGRR